MSDVSLVHQINLNVFLPTHIHLNQANGFVYPGRFSWLSKMKTLAHNPLFQDQWKAFNLTLALVKKKRKKGVSIMDCDTPCPITSSNITSFNLYNARIDPSCYHGAIAAEGSAQLSFGGCLNPSHFISERQKSGQPCCFWALSLGHPSSQTAAVWATLGRYVAVCFPEMCKCTIVGMRWYLCTLA